MQIAIFNENALDMEACEELIQIESEELTESLLATVYFDLSPELKLWIRTKGVKALGLTVEMEQTIAVA
jgi:hypothetical protein